MPRPEFSPRTDYAYFKHQLEHDPVIRDEKVAFRVWATGTGKTRSALEDMSYNYCMDRIDAAVVVAPVDVHRKIWFEQQGYKWLAVPGGRIMAFNSKGSCTAQEWRDLLAFTDYDGFKLLVTYYEAVSSVGGYDYLKGFVADSGRVMCTLDESHRIMTPGTSASTRLSKMRDKFEYRRNQTATPTANGIEDLYAQFRWLDPAIFGCTTQAEFRGMFISEIPIEGTHRKRVVGYRNVKYLNKRMAPFVYVAKEHDGLPPKHYSEIITSMSDEQWQAYHELKNEFQTQLRTGHWVDADLSIVRLKRLQQIVSGHLPVMDPNDESRTKQIIELDCPRIQDTIDAVKGCPHKVIIWAQEQYEIERLTRELKNSGVDAMMYYGKISKGVERDKVLDRFEHDKDAKCLVANDAIGGTGLELVGAAEPVQDHIFYSHTWSRLLRTQCEGRSRRPGTKAEHMIFHDVIAPRTTDTRILARRKQKDDIAMLVADPREVAKLLDDDLDYELDMNTPVLIQ